VILTSAVAQVTSNLINPHGWEKPGSKGAPLPGTVVLMLVKPHPGLFVDNMMLPNPVGAGMAGGDWFR
jgi:hypothetical protein